MELKVKSQGLPVHHSVIKQENLLGQLAVVLAKHRLPISIAISELKPTTSPSQHHQPQSPALQYQQQDYDIAVLRQQVTLFDTPQQIHSYLSTQQLLAHDPLVRMTQLASALILLARQHLLTPALAPSLPPAPHLTAEQLDAVEQQCMDTLGRVQEERKRMARCVVCWQRARELVLQPCMHVVVCGGCVGAQCPVCKAPVEKTAKLYM